MAARARSVPSACLVQNGGTRNGRGGDGELGRRCPSEFRGRASSSGQRDPPASAPRKQECGLGTRWTVGRGWGAEAEGCWLPGGRVGVVPFRMRPWCGTPGAGGIEAVRPRPAAPSSGGKAPPRWRSPQAHHRAAERAPAGACTVSRPLAPGPPSVADVEPEARSVILCGRLHGHRVSPSRGEGSQETETGNQAIACRVGEALEQRGWQPRLVHWGRQQPAGAFPEHRLREGA